MNANEISDTLKALLEQEERIERLEKMFELLEPITDEGIENLRNAAKARVIEVMGGESSLAYIRIGDKTVNACMRQVRMELCVPRYSELKKTDYEEALRLIRQWKPCGHTQVAIQYFKSAEEVAKECGR